MKDGDAAHSPGSQQSIGQAEPESQYKSSEETSPSTSQTFLPENPDESDEERVNQGLDQIADLQYKASLYDTLREENTVLRQRVDAMSAKLEEACSEKSVEETRQEQTAVLMNSMADQMQTIQRAMQSQMQVMQEQITAQKSATNPFKQEAPVLQKPDRSSPQAEKPVFDFQQSSKESPNTPLQNPKPDQESPKESGPSLLETLSAKSLNMNHPFLSPKVTSADDQNSGKQSFPVPSNGPLTFSETQVPRVQIPALNQMPKYDGSEKGLAATSWLIDLEQMRPLYNLQDVQLVALARCSLVGKARSWTETLPFNQTWEQFNKAFCREWGERNQERLFVEMLNHQQGESSVGEYATNMPRHFMQLDVSADKQKEYFVKNLRPGIKESTFSRNPVTLAEAVEVAREAENIYYTVNGKRNEPGTEVKEIKKKVDMLALQKASTSAANVQSLSIPASRPPRCPKCLQEGHAVPSLCTNEPKVPLLSCCNYWGRHRPGSPCESQPIPPMPSLNSKMSNSQTENTNMMEETPLQYSDSNSHKASGLGHDLFAGEQASDSDLGETSYISSDESSSGSDVQEISTAKRTRETGAFLRAGSAAPPAKKTRKKDPTYTPETKSAHRPVKNKRILPEQNHGIPHALLQDCAPKISAHRHLKHFRTDTHRYLDKLLSHTPHDRKMC